MISKYYFNTKQIMLNNWRDLCERIESVYGYTTNEHVKNICISIINEIYVKLR